MMNRREFLQGAAALTGVATGRLPLRAVSGGMHLGLVTYMWGAKMDLPTVIRSCEQSGLLGVELRTEHAHGVEPALTKSQRMDVRKRFEDSPVTLLGYGANSEYHSPDPAVLKKNIEDTKAYVRLMAECGGTGVKVKPNTLPAGVPKEKTIEQIGKALTKWGPSGQTTGRRSAWRSTADTRRIRP
jgi:sugar phosphate isomerase/epimerase